MVKQSEDNALGFSEVNILPMCYIHAFDPINKNHMFTPNPDSSETFFDPGPGPSLIANHRFQQTPVISFHSGLRLGSGNNQTMFSNSPF